MDLKVDDAKLEKQDMTYSREELKSSPLSKVAQQVDRAASISLPKDVWYQKARPMVDRNVVKSVVGEDAHDKFESDLRAEFQKLASSNQHTASFVQQIFNDDDLLTMQGVAIIATYLKEKHRLNNLFVCNSLEAMQNKLAETQNSKEDGRYALVIGNYCEVPDQIGEQTDAPSEYTSTVNHKIMIGVEKKGSEIKVVLMDALDEDLEGVSPKFVLSPVRDLEHSFGVNIEVILWYLCQVLSPENTKIYYSNVNRQNTYYGCETFALKDALFFLRDPAFFEKIQVETKLLTENQYHLILGEIQSLPPAFMKGAQSRRLLAQYNESETYSSKEEKENLKTHVTNHLVSVEDKQHNYYINRQSFKYHLFVLNVLKVMSEEAIQSVIQKTFLRAYRAKNGEFPKTLSDLRFWSPVVIESLPEGKSYPESWSSRGH